MAKLKKDGTPSKQGEGGGQPPKYGSEKELREKILSYFKDTDEKRRMYSKAGLLFHLDISRTVYSEYRKKYTDAIRFADTAIEEDWVNRLSETGATGAIFYLKNAFRENYKDRQEIDHSNKGEKFDSLASLSNEQLEEYIKARSTS